MELVTVLSGLELRHAISLCKIIFLVLLDFHIDQILSVMFLDGLSLSFLQFCLFLSEFYLIIRLLEYKVLLVLLLWLILNILLQYFIPSIDTFCIVCWLWLMKTSSKLFYLRNFIMKWKPNLVFLYALFVVRIHVIIYLINLWHWDIPPVLFSMTTFPLTSVCLDHNIAIQFIGERTCYRVTLF